MGPRHSRATGWVNYWLMRADRNEKKHIINHLGAETRLIRETFQRASKLAHVMDDPVGSEVLDGNFGVAERDADDGNPGATGDPDIRAGIAHHDRGGYLPAGAGHGLAQDAGVRLGNPERIGAANGGKSRAQVQPVQQALRQPFELVGANRQPVSEAGKIIQRALDALERPGRIRDVLGIMADEVVGQAADVGRAGVAALQFQAALDQLCAPAPIILRAE